MVSEEGERPKSDIRNLVEDSLKQGGGSEESPTPHDKILEESERLRRAIKQEANKAGKEDNEFDKRMYLSAYLLNTTLSYLLDGSTAISKYDPETNGLDNTESTAEREDFVHKISRALTHLGMDGDAVQKALIKSGDVNE